MQEGWGKDFGFRPARPGNGACLARDFGLKGGGSSPVERDLRYAAIGSPVKRDLPACGRQALCCDPVKRDLRYASIGSPQGVGTTRFMF